MIVLVTNSRKPYAYDIQQILGLPSHAEYRFRYDSTKWIVEGLQKKNLKGHKALIVLRNYDTGQLHPCRYVEITEQTDVGHIRHFRFRLRGYVSEASSARIVKTLGNWLSENGLENASGNKFKAFVHENDSLKKEESGEDADSSWVAIVKDLKDISSYKDFGFLRIRSVTAASQACFMSQTSSGEYSFQIQPGTTCVLDVAQYMPSQIGEGGITHPYDVIMKVPTALNSIRDHQRVVGKYDLLKFVFDAPDASAGKSTEIAILAEQTGEAAEYGIHALFIPLEVERRHWFARVMAVAAGIALLVVAGWVKEANANDLIPATIQALAFVLITLAGAAELLKDMLA